MGVDKQSPAVLKAPKKLTDILYSIPVSGIQQAPFLTRKGETKGNLPPLRGASKRQATSFKLHVE